MSAEKHRVWRAKLPIIGIVMGLLGISFLSFASFSTLAKFQEHAGWVDHTHNVRLELEQTIFLVADAQAATRGFVIGGGLEFLAPYEHARRMLPSKLNDLAVQVADNPVQIRNVSLLKIEIERTMDLLAHSIALRLDNDTAAPALANVAEGNGKVALDGLRTLVTTMQRRESELLVKREQKVIGGARETKALIVFGTLAAYLIFGGAFWLLVREVAQRKRADTALLAANEVLLHRAELLEQANKELESFTYSISHDLRIPLRAVAGYASMLAEDYTDKLDREGQRLLGVIRENSKRMGSLIDDLLALSRMGRQAISSTDIEMRALVASVVADSRQRDDTCNANVVLEPLPRAWGDRALLQQVWVNLVSNAIKYSSKTTAAEIRISGARSGNEIVYSVRDNGVGFDMLYYNKLFGVFQRLHDADEFPGSGVGLAIVQRIVQRHGGRVWAESAIDQGATFFFALPHKG